MNYQLDSILSEEQLDFITEIFNIGAGNAATAFSQIIGRDVNVKVVDIKMIDIQIIFDLFIVYHKITCVKTDIIGDTTGTLFFIFPYGQDTKLINLVKNTNIGNTINFNHKDIISEIVNIIAGVYLTSIHDFCKLEIYHTVPIMMTHTLESLSRDIINIHKGIMIEIIFNVTAEYTNTIVIMTMSVESLIVFANSINIARKMILNN